MRSVSIAAIVLLGFAGTQPVFSQAGASAGIYGSVLDAQGAIIPGVRVTLQHVRTNQVRTAVTNQPGDCYVLKAAPKFERLATNSLGERVLSSPAISEGIILIRSYQHLWCIAEQKQP